jgi:hypothetical protein
MISIKAEVKAEVLEAEEEEAESTGEGGVVVHGTVTLSTAERADLFLPDLEQRVVSVRCGLCPAPAKSWPHTTLPGLPAWRAHLRARHPAAPGLRPQLVALPPAQAVGVHPCGRQCGQAFPSLAEAEEHQESVVWAVRLVCPQCRGQHGDLESHLAAAHGGAAVCRLCDKLVEGGTLAAHHKATHRGFASVLVESVASCAGDGAHLTWQETVLATKARFSAEEVKPATVVAEEDPPPPLPLKLAGNEFLFKNSTKSLVMLHRASAALSLGKVDDAVATWRPQLQDERWVMSEQDRMDYNVQVYNKFKESGAASSRNECEICGFVPYTKNKYREKQDHLSKFHFKERIDAVMPANRPYACPAADCSYLGKDKQDVLRHYTGKHNILKMWVDAFIKERSGTAVPPPLAVKRRAGGEELTFNQMEVRARASLKALRPPPPLAPASPAKVVLTADGHHSALSISRVGRVFSNSPGAEPEPTAVSITRVPRPDPPPCPDHLLRPATTIASTLLLGMATRSQPPPSPHKVVGVRCKFCADLGLARTFATIGLWKDHCMGAHADLERLAVPSAEPEVRPKQRCPACGMAFPSGQALGLHREVCQEAGGLVGEDTELGAEEVEVEEISIKEETIDNEEVAEPARKKARRPPPGLIPI